MRDSSFAVYVHVPFCPTKCGYCDFNSYAMEGEIQERTAHAIATEIRRSPWAGRPARTIFFGGGTPTYLREDLLLGILEAVLETHPPVEGAEITSEANPGTVDAAKFHAMRAGGFNRISLGAQSFQDSDLLRLGRVHRSGEIERAVAAAREAGFENLNLDLMFALPNQSARGWKTNLERAFALDPEHLSLYCLTIEPNTAFFKEHRRGDLPLPDEESQVAMYDECLQLAADKGYRQYEISNFAKPGRECRHNLEYWRGAEYAGYGPGAVGMVGNVRRTNLKHPKRYCDAVEGGVKTAYDEEPLSAEILQTERIMLGLRLNEGLPLELLRDPRGLDQARAKGWVEDEGDRVRLTAAGRHFCSEVALALI